MSVKTIVAIGISSAVPVILGRFVVTPTGIPNTNLETLYPFLISVSVVFGPVAGGLIDLIDHTLKDLTTYGSAWWSWIVCPGAIGIIFDFAGHKMDLRHGEFITNDMVRLNIFQAFGDIAVWGLIAPSLDILIYSGPASKVFIQGVFATVSNIVAVRIIGTLLMKAYASTGTKKGGLSKSWGTVEVI